jgi:hypothetical protein
MSVGADIGQPLDVVHPIELIDASIRGTGVR